MAGANHLSILRGIFCVGPAGNGANVSINNNTITLKSSATGGQAFSAIESNFGATPTAGNVVSKSNNTITGTYATASAGANMVGILNTGNGTTVNTNGNSVQNYSLPAEQARLRRSTIQLEQAVMLP